MILQQQQRCSGKQIAGPALDIRPRSRPGRTRSSPGAASATPAPDRRIARPALPPFRTKRPYCIRLPCRPRASGSRGRSPSGCTARDGSRRSARRPRGRVGSAIRGGGRRRRRARHRARIAPAWSPRSPRPGSASRGSFRHHGSRTRCTARSSGRGRARRTRRGRTSGRTSPGRRRSASRSTITTPAISVSVKRIRRSPRAQCPAVAEAHDRCGVVELDRVERHRGVASRRRA